MHAVQVRRARVPVAGLLQAEAAWSALLVSGVAGTAVGTAFGTDSGNGASAGYERTLRKLNLLGLELELLLLQRRQYAPSRHAAGTPKQHTLTGHCAWKSERRHTADVSDTQLLNSIYSAQDVNVLAIRRLAAS